MISVNELLKDSSGWRCRDPVVQESDPVQWKAQRMSQVRGEVFIEPIVDRPCVIACLVIECLKFSGHILAVERALGQQESRRFISRFPGPCAQIKSEYVHLYQVDHSLNPGVQVRVNRYSTKEPLEALGIQLEQILAAVGVFQPLYPESTEGGRRVSVLKWPKGAPLNLG